MPTNAQVLRDRHRDVVEEIKRRTVEVAAAHREYLDALVADRDAHAELLSEVVHVVTPALPALASRVIVGAVMSSAGTTTTDASWRGVPILTDTGEPFGKPRAERGQDPARGRFGGRTLYLEQSGRFWELAFQGTWSSVPGEVSSWRADAYGKGEVAVANEWDVEAILDRLAVVLRQQVSGAKDERTRAMGERAERIRSLAKLARSL